MARSYTPDELAAAEGLLLLWASRSVTATPRDVQGAASNNHEINRHGDTEHSQQHDDMQTSRVHDVDMLPPSPLQSRPHPHLSAPYRREPSSTSHSRVIQPPIPVALLPQHPHPITARTATQNSFPGLRANIPPFHEEGSPQYAQDQEQRQITRLMILRHVMNNRPPGRAEAARQNIMQRFPPRGSRLDREQNSRLGRIPGAARDRASRLPPRFLPARNSRPAESRHVSSGSRDLGHNGSTQHNLQTNTAAHDASGRTANPATGVNGSAASPSHQEQSTADSQPGLSLQKYLIRQQMIAGVQPEEIAPIRPQGMVNRPSAPVVLQIRADAVAVPRIPPAQFSGPLQPLRIVPRGAPGLINGPVTRNTALHSHPVNQTPEPKSEDDKPAATDDKPQPQTPQRPASSRYLTRSVTRRTRDQNSLLTSTPDSQAQASAVVKSEGDTNPAAHPPRLLPNIPAPDNNTNINILWAQEQFPEKEPRQPSTIAITIPHNNFDLLSALSAHPELTVMVTDLLHPEDILTLLSLSRPLHRTLHPNLPTITTHHLQDLNTNHPANISDTFPLICYPALYTTNPSNPNPHPHPKLSYLLMLTTRTTTINRILTTLLAANIFLPAGTALILRKLWFLMDVPDNHRREWTVRNRNLWSDLDLFLGVFFLVQVDAFLEEVKGVAQFTVMRQLCLAQPSLVVLAEYLEEGRCKRGGTLGSGGASTAAGQEEKDGEKKGADGDDGKDEDMLGVKDANEGHAGPAVPEDPEPTEPTTPTAAPTPTAPSSSPPTEEDLGPLQYEYYGRKNTPHEIKLLRPDQWIMRELLHRGLDLQKMYKLVFGGGGREQFETPGIAGQRVTWDEQMRTATLRSQVDWMEVVRLDR
ncbi:hypothetical protein BO99DRAFT_467305 [Aspergillus violaceofuscus CBS 115571]|uniref:Uncharacterized protein n=1 Tax=Aspergillus violaceofuscus (strain CBS 115571) TaxID=1450538 RepID=A0A2V5HEW0_ASPV1|nr:hypothetical protein BO99DRAFT_467305 [Aspergillus violaceofuscus CBS 115571]